MPPRLNLFSPRSITFRTKPLIPRKRISPFPQHRFASHDESQSTPKGPNQEQLPPVSEEQAALDKIMGDTPPDIEQGTPIQEILDRDPEAKEKAPEVLKNSSKKLPHSQSRSYSTSARRHTMDTEIMSSTDSLLPVSMEYPEGGFGHKFALPEVGSIPRSDHLKRRYDIVVDQVTKSLMRHGKLSKAQKDMSIILDTLRAAPPPLPNPQFPARTLLSPLSREALPLSPIAYLTTAIDSVSPLLKIRQQRGVMGGGASLPIPVPLGVRQRRRVAIQWILAIADNRREVNLADRVAKEIISVAEGKSSAWERRALVHKMAMSARSNVRQLMIIRSARKLM